MKNQCFLEGAQIMERMRFRHAGAGSVSHQANFHPKHPVTKEIVPAPKVPELMRDQQNRTSHKSQFRQPPP
jgi:hypothetical protein